MTIAALHQNFLECDGIRIDNRKIVVNDMFFAISGDNFNANTFAKNALEAGAKYAIIDDQDFYVDERTILVQNGLQTLQNLATFHRNFLNIPVIALTGSNGKTTTKELIDIVLKQKFRTTATVGNLNNHIGVPLTLLSFTKSTEIGIVEMGANHQKEIEFLCELALPDYGYITNFGKAHLEGFGGVDGVIKAKSEMYVHLRENHKIAFVNIDDALQIDRSVGIEQVFFGIKNEKSFVDIETVEANPFVKIKFSNTIVNSNLIGLYNANNINVAITIGKYFGIQDEVIKTAIEAYIPDNNRSQMILKNGNEIILDAYNANPSSMAVAIDNFLQLDKPNKFLFLGDMFELGDESIVEHQEIINKLKASIEVLCFFVGYDFYKCKSDEKHYVFFETFDDLKQNFDTSQFHDAAILIKGSRGMALERILELL